jgi:hypothetical protein
MSRPISTIAAEILEDWVDVSPHARPYLDAMVFLDDINDRHGADDAESILLYFLTNAGRWRGPKAKALKKELRGILKGADRGRMASRVAARYRRGREV